MRKIDAMHAMFGVLPDKRCEDCANLIQGDYHERHYRKCLIYGATHSEATDWRKKYVACGMYNRDWQACVRTWARRDQERGVQARPQSSGNAFADLVREGVFEDEPQDRPY